MPSTALRRAALAALASLTVVPALADHEPLGAIEPSADEQVGIYEINRARDDPQAYGEEIHFDLTGIDARQPLAVNPNLSGSARFHARLMLEHHEYGHVSDLLGIGPNQMAVDNGYDLFLSGLARDWGTTNTIESILRSVNQVATTTAAVRTFIVDKDVPGAGHRMHLLAIGAYTDHREIGFGWAAGTDSFPEFGLPRPLPTKLAAIHTAYGDFAQTFLTGVVFEDRNGNRRYDKGEGVEGATISVDGGGGATSMKQGGWALEVDAGEHVVRCSGGAFRGSSVAFVHVATDNREIDFHSGRGLGEVDFAWRDGYPTGGPDVAIEASAEVGVAPLTVTLAGSGLSGGVYAWDLGDGRSADGPVVQPTYDAPGLYPVVLDGLDARGLGSALRLVVATGAEGAGGGTTPPADTSLLVVKGQAKRKLKTAGRDLAKLSGVLEMPGGFAPSGVIVQASVAGATRTFTLDGKGRATLPDGSRIALKASWPTDGSGIAAGTVAKLTILVRGDLAHALEGAGLRDRTEARTVEDVPCALLVGGLPYRAEARMTTRAVAGRSAKGTLAPSPD